MRSRLLSRENRETVYVCLYGLLLSIGCRLSFRSSLLRTSFSREEQRSSVRQKRCAKASFTLAIINLCQFRWTALLGSTVGAAESQVASDWLSLQQRGFPDVDVQIRAASSTVFREKAPVSRLLSRQFSGLISATKVGNYWQRSLRGH